MPLHARLRSLWPLPVALALVVLAPWIIDVSADGIGLSYHLDTHVYRSGAEAVLAGDNPYTRLFSVQDTALPFTYPPLAAVLFIPLTWVSVELGGFLMTVVSLAALVLVLVVTLRSLNLPVVLALWLLPLAALFEPVRDTISFGQINLLLMAAVVVDTLGPKHRLTGALSGLAAAVKLTPAVFVVFFLIRRDYRSAATMAGSALAATAAAALAAPETSLHYLRTTLVDTERIGAQSYSKNQSLTGALSRIFDAQTVDTLWLLLVPAVIVLALVAAWRVRRHQAGLLSVVSLISLLCSPVSWSHHWVWLVVIALVFLAAARTSRGAWGMLGVVVVAAVLPPHALLPHDDGREATWTLAMHIVGDTFVWIAVAVLFIGALCPRVLSAAPSRGARPATWRSRAPENASQSAAG